MTAAVRQSRVCAMPFRFRRRLPFKSRWAIFLAAALFCGVPMAQQSAGTGNQPAQPAPSGPIRLSPPQASPQAPGAGSQPPRSTDRDRTERGDRPARGDRDERPDGQRGERQPYVPGEFEAFVQRMTFPTVVRRFGAELVTGDVDLAPEVALPPPSDYVLGPGDELTISLWGSVEAELRPTIDREGRIHVPRAGTLMVAGTKLSDLDGLVTRHVAQAFRNFQVSASLGRVRSARVFVTGFVVNPGVYTVSGLSTITAALLQAGGPSSAGSFRSIQVLQGGRAVASFDLYDLLLRGDRQADRILRSGDVVHVQAVGPQVAVLGSVNRQGIFELKPGETVGDVLQMAGGFTAIADRTRIAIERLAERAGTRVSELGLPAQVSRALDSGDILRAFSAVSVATPSDRRAKRVRVEGEVERAGEYVLPAGSSLSDAIRAAGGVTRQGYIYATEFSRESVRESQRENYERALRDLETDLARAAAAQRAATTEDTAELAARQSGSNRLLERLRALQPTGRVVLQLPIDASDLPDFALEDGDRVHIPPKPTTVGVFGSVFNTGSYLFNSERTLADYLRLAGGPTRGADEASVFVVRANGSVISQLQSAGFFSRGDALAQAALPGDTIFVPEELNKSTFLQVAKDWTLLLYQLGIGLAGIRSAIR
ncbi:MAG: SLBB domain-containing protein [Rubrivivax sp.]|nr:SLBB domain-containing protein [Rubrivivax sp.]